MSVVLPGSKNSSQEHWNKAKGRADIETWPVAVYRRATSRNEVDVTDAHNKQEPGYKADNVTQPPVVSHRVTSPPRYFP